MDLGIVITAGIGIVTTFCSGLFTFLFSKKKYNTEVDTNIINNVQTTLNVYQDMVKDLGKKLDVYSAIVDKNKIEVIRLKSVVTKMVGMVCTRKDCTKRCSYSDKDLQDILDAVEFNTSNITITYNNKDE